MTTDIKNDQFSALRQYLSMESPTAYYPAPVPDVLALAQEYAKLPGALQPLPVRKFSSLFFQEHTNLDKITQVYRELDGANSCGTPQPTVPASWAAWLLDEFDQLNTATLRPAF